jgi:hypothetical protein
MGANTEKKPSRGNAQIQTWQAPSAGWVQINTDGAYAYELGKWGWGAVCGVLNVQI